MKNRQAATELPLHIHQAKKNYSRSQDLVSVPDLCSPETLPSSEEWLWRKSDSEQQQCVYWGNYSSQLAISALPFIFLAVGL